MLEGDIEERPENVLVYATSNRRSLIPEVEMEEKFPSESLQERVSREVSLREPSREGFPYRQIWYKACLLCL